MCNACGVRWASRRRGSRKPAEEASVPHAKEAQAVEPEETGGALEQYYCKYCGMTWPLNFFKNRQQFGAHCSNCSRKRKSRETGPVGADATSAADYTLTGSSPTGPFLPHLNLRSALPRKAPREPLRFAHPRFSQGSTEYPDHDEFDDLYPPAKKSKSLPPGPDSGDETYYDSDSETVSSPYGPSASSLYRLLGAVENVLTEEREMATTASQMQAVRAMIDSLDETRKTTLAHLEQSLLSQLEYLHRSVTPAAIASAIERQKAAVLKQQALQNSQAASSVAPASDTANAMQGVTPLADPVSAAPNSGMMPSELDMASTSDSTATAHVTPMASIPSAPIVPAAPVSGTQSAQVVAEEAREEQILKSSILAVQSAEAHIEAAMGPHVDAPPEGSVAVPPVTLLPADLEKAADELVTVFTNATVLQLGSQEDIEAFKNMFVHILTQAKAGINQDVAALFEALVALKARQTLLGQGTFLDHMQLRAVSADLNALKQRVVSSSRAIQGMFVQLVSQFSEQIETAKRIYQENAGNHVRLLDEVVRSRLTPALVQEVDQLRSELLAHINCVHANLAYLDTLVLTTE